MIKDSFLETLVSSSFAALVTVEVYFCDVPQIPNLQFCCHFQLHAKRNAKQNKRVGLRGGAGRVGVTEEKSK